LPTSKKPVETEEDEESSEEEAATGHKSNLLYAVLGGALTALSAFAFYKARS
jgi:LPXTG-motif cell wall-anchored protein